MRFPWNWLWLFSHNAENNERKHLKFYQIWTKPSYILEKSFKIKQKKLYIFTHRYLPLNNKNENKIAQHSTCV